MELKRYRILFVLIALLNGSEFLFAEDSVSKVVSLDTALAAYKEGRFEQALGEFTQLNRSVESAGLYYNMANCHMKMGKTGFAIACYLSALKRDATDPDILHNLNYARAQTKDRLSEDKTIGFWDVVLNLVRHFTLRQHQILFLFFYLLAFTLLISGYALNKKWRGLEGILILVLSCAILQSIFLYISFKDYSRVQGVVIVEKTSLRYGPSQTDTEAFELHEGAEFQVFNRMGGWYQARISDGKVGWIFETQCAVIN